MVGQPKSLYDLRKVEGAVSVTCKACGKSRLYDLEELIKSRVLQRQSTDWQIVEREMPCWHCPERTETKVAVVPYAASDRELRVRRADMLLMNLALNVLHSAAYGARQNDIDTPAVRLALRVLRPFLPDCSLLIRFWKEGKAAKGQAMSEAVLAHGWIAQALVKQGHSVWAEFRRVVGTFSARSHEHPSSSTASPIDHRRMLRYSLRLQNRIAKQSWAKARKASFSAVLAGIVQW